MEKNSYPFEDSLFKEKPKKQKKNKNLLRSERVKTKKPKIDPIDLDGCS